MLKITMLSLMTTLSLFAISNHELAVKSDAVMKGFGSSEAKMSMTLINASGSKRERSMYMKVLEKEGGNKSLMEFLTPSDVKGTKFLSYEHTKKDDDQWLYLPALKRVKRIASRNKSGAFMGSEFSYEDLSAFNIDKYNYVGDAEVVELDGKKVYKSPRTPKSKDSGYTKQVSYVDVETFLAQKVEYFDRKKELLKVSLFSGYNKVEGIWRVSRISMKNLQNDKETVLIWSDEKIKIGLKDKDFHKRVLKK